MGPRASLDGCGISRPHRDSIPGHSDSWRVAIPTALSHPNTHTHTHTNTTVREISPFTLIHPPYRPTHSMCTRLRKQFYAQQETNVNCFSEAVSYSLDEQSYNSDANGGTYLITAASSVELSHIS
jgi:hypothetical protein